MKKAKRNVIISAIMAIALCVSLMAGATFALFTDKSEVNIAVTSGKVDIEATISDFEAYSPKSISAEEGNAIIDNYNIADNSGQVKVFGNLGTATLDGSEIKLNNVTPGDKVTFTITVKNFSNVKTQYRTSVKKVANADGTASDDTLFDALKFTIGGMTVQSSTIWENLDIATDSINGDIVGSYECSVELPAAIEGDTYQNKSCTIAYLVEAIQGNAATKDVNTTVMADLEGKVTTSDDGVTKTTEIIELVSADSIAINNSETVSVATATVPKDVKIADTATELKLSVKETATDSNFTIEIADTQVAKTLDVTMEGLHSDNTTPVKVTMFVGKGLTGFSLYHKSELMEAKSNVDEVTADQDYYYDKTTGLVTMKTSKFSPFTYVYDATGTKTITNSTELEAALADSETKTIKLGAAWCGDMIVNGADGVTLDFNGYTVDGTMYIGCKNDSWTSESTPSTLTLKDSIGNGGITTTNNTAIYLKNASKLTIDSGNYVCKYAKEGSSGYSQVIKITNCELIVNGGYIHNDAQVGSYNRVICINNGKLSAKVTINGGKLEGTKENHATQWTAGSYSYIIASLYSDDVNVNVTINGGDFISHTSYSWMTTVNGNVIINNCVFTDYGVGSAFDIGSESTVTVKGGTFNLAEHLDYFGNVVSGLVNCRLSDGWTSTKGTLVIEPTSLVKINYQTHSKFLAEGATQSEQDADGYYTISRNADFTA